MLQKAIEYLVVSKFAAAGVQINGPNPCDLQVKDKRVFKDVFFGGSLALGEAYMRGDVECKRSDLLISKMLKSGIDDHPFRIDNLMLRFSRRMFDRQNHERTMRVADHYNVSPKFYEQVLGPSKVYTCARFCDGADDLEGAQREKMKLLCRKINLKPGQSLLDIGSGWGGLLAYAARAFGAKNSVGLSISEAQVKSARKEFSGLPIDFRLEDYRDFTGKVDAITSVCMIEHVREAYLRGYFAKARAALKSPTGLFGLQCIFAKDEHSTVDSWLNKYIFPGGELLTQARLRKAIEGLFYIIDEEYFPRDYVRTLLMWCENLRAHREEIVAEYGIEFFRMYEYYFQLCAGGFQSGRITVGQIVLCPTDIRDSYEPVRL